MFMYLLLVVFVFLLSLCDGSSVSSTVGSPAAARFGTACRAVSVLEFQGHHGISALVAATEKSKECYGFKTH
jgi:hypothetical protein